MYSGLLPRGLTEADLSSDADEDAKQDSNCESPAAKTDPLEVHSALAHPDSCTLPGISQEAWQKFQDLRKKRNDIKPVVDKERKRRRRKPKKRSQDKESVETSREQEEKSGKHWDELKRYFGANDRFHPPASSKPPPKSGLEKSIEEAIAEGDIAKAEEMSDRLATRELGVMIAEAADCRDFAQRKQEEEELRAAQKRQRQIAWGFEAKRRWETKSNMGYM